MVENFDEIALSPSVKEIEGNFVLPFLAKMAKIQNGRHFYFFKLQDTMLDTLWVENFDEIALSRRVKEMQFVFCHFWQNFRKFKMAAIFGEGKILGKLQRLQISF